jgi:hypothetical protein
LIIIFLFGWCVDFGCCHDAVTVHSEALTSCNKS